MPNKLSPVQVNCVLGQYDAYPEGGKTRAIKLYREYAQCDLKEARDGVERLVSLRDIAQGDKSELKADEPCDLVIDIGGYRAFWDEEARELRIPFSRADYADEAQEAISMRLERAKP